MLRAAWMVVCTLYRHLAALATTQGRRGCRPTPRTITGPFRGQPSGAGGVESARLGATIHAEVRCGIATSHGAPHGAAFPLMRSSRASPGGGCPGRSLLRIGQRRSGVDDETSLLHRDLPDVLRRPGIWPPCPAPQLGQHGGRQALWRRRRDAAQAAGAVHGIARGAAPHLSKRTSGHLILILMFTMLDHRGK
jgi:hypothetical protein